MRKTTTMQKYLAKFALLLTLLAFPMAALASPVSDAKANGLVGEQSDGYLGSVAPNPTAAVKALLDDINAKRKAEYERVARETNTGLKAIEMLSGQKAIEKTTPGNYVKLDGGSWTKK